MRLYLAQHGEATPEEINPDRPLTKKGRQDSAKTAEFLKASGIEPDIIWHSAKSRAVETAQIFAQNLLPKEGTIKKEGLAPNDPVAEVFAAIVSIKKNVMIVGHLPFLQKLVSLALFNSESSEAIRFSKGGVVCLEKNEKWQLIFELTPDLLA